MSAVSILNDSAAVWEAPPSMTIDEWADNYRVISPGNAEPGPWMTEKVPYTREVMRCITDRSVRRVVLEWASQLSKTELILNSIGFYSHLEPSTILWVLPNNEMAAGYSSTRLAPMIRDTPELRAVYADPKSRSGSNKIREKQFRGGHVVLVGAESPAALSGRPIRILLLDEVDRMPMSSGKEGDPISLSSKRTSTYWNAKHIITGTPVDLDTSKIHKSYLAGTQEQWFIPCSSCGHFQVMAFERLDFKSLEHKCENCKKSFDQVTWLASSQSGEWRAGQLVDQYGRPLTTRSFHLSALVSPWVQWQDIVAEFLEGTRLAKQGDITTLKSWTNTVQAKPWESRGDRTDEGLLMKRREYWEGEVPEKAVFLTAGVDVQQGRLEYSVYAWAPGRESWLVEHGKIWGQTSDPFVWEELDRLVYNREFHYSESAGFPPIRVSRMFVDSGYLTEHVYTYTKRREPRVYASKGRAGLGLAVCSDGGYQGNVRARLQWVSVDVIKEESIIRLKIEEAGPGYVHFGCGPNGEEVRGADLEFFKGLCAERRVTKFKNGAPKTEWHKSSWQPNEPLDAYVYAYAALDHAFYGRVNEGLERAAKERTSNEPKKQIQFGVYKPGPPTPQQLSPLPAAQAPAGEFVPRWRTNGRTQNREFDPRSL